MWRIIEAGSVVAPDRGVVCRPRSWWTTQPEVQKTRELYRTSWGLRAMTAPVAIPAEPADTGDVADLRAAAHGAGIAARIAPLTFAAELALETLPAGPERDEGSRALDVAARFAAGETVDPDKIAEAMLHEDVGLFIHHDSVCGKPEADAWDAVLSVLGYAAWQGYQLRGHAPDPLVENYALEGALDWTINPLAKVPHLDWAGLARATAGVREHASEAGEGWGQPLRVDDLRRAAGRCPQRPPCGPG